MNLYEYLQNQRTEELPEWLARFSRSDRFSSNHFFESRVVYYPGSGTDGHPVKLFGSTHSAHCFVYADYHLTQDELETELSHPRHAFRGYHTFARLQLQESDFVAKNWTHHVDTGDVSQNNYWFATVATAPFGFLEILERDYYLEDTHGAHRLAILFLGADGIAAYDALFCQKDSGPAPFAVVLQDHGFGGNYDSFGQGGLLERIARRCNIIPRWLLVAANTKPWQGFEPVPNVDGDHGGMHNTLRILHERREAQLKQA